ncbi:unnamed protein product, partial [marine sediment metagenome]
EVLFEKGLRFARDIDDRGGALLLGLYHGTISNLRGDGANAVEYLQRCAGDCEELQYVAVQGLAWTFLAWAYCILGESDTARNYVQKGLEAQTSAGMPAYLSLVYVFSAMVHLDSGDVATARHYVEEALKRSQDSGQRMEEGLSRVLLGRILGKADISEVEEAESQIVQGISILDDLGIRPLCSWGHFFLGELYADTGQTEKALETLKKAEGMMQEMGMDYWLRRTQEVMARVQG